MTFPGDREGPAHNQLPDLVEKACVKRLGKTRWKAHGLLRGLYVMRVNADYHPSVEVGPGDAREALSMMREVFRLMERADHGKAGKKRNR
jgi:hypothetical protein